MVARSDSLPIHHRKCRRHTHDIIAAFCKPCNAPVCMQCIIQIHNGDGHTIIDLFESLKMKKEELSDFQQILTDKILPSFNLAKDLIHMKSDDFNSKILSLKESVESRRIDAKDLVDKICDSMQDSIDDLAIEHKRNMAERDSEVTAACDTIEGANDECNSLMNSNIDSISTFLKEKEDLAVFSPPKIPKYHPPVLLPGKLMMSSLCRQIGTLVHVEKILDQPTPCPPNNIVFSDGPSALEVWTSNVESKKIEKYEFENENILPKPGTELDFKVQNLAMSQHAELLASDRHSHSIFKIQKNKKASKLVNTTNAHPNGVVINSRQEIVICVCGFSGKISIYSPNGKNKLQDISNDRKGRIVANDPQQIIQNGNGDYVFTDRNIQQYSVVAIDNAGTQLRWIFQGSGNVRKEDFKPLGLACDKFWNILVSDYAHNEVIILSRDGEYLHCLLTSEHGISKPLGVGVDREGRLWVGQEHGRDGKLSVFKYHLQSTSSHPEKNQGVFVKHYAPGGNRV